jgi:YidC/Oxa1 family membrane protein insertase
MMTATADANQRRMMLALPFFFTIFIFTFPGGLLVYWITTNLWTIGQQYFVRRRVGPPPAPATGAGGPGPRGAGPQSDDGGSPRGGAPRGSPTPEPALAGARAGGGGGAPPPRPPRKKKKRSGRRR